MAYGTPTYNYERARSGLTERKGFEDVSRDFGRFMGQERFRRSAEDANLQFKNKFPKLNTHFNRRGMWNSGLRRGGQREFAQDFRRDQNRMQYDQAAMNTQYDMDQTRSDAGYQRALVDLFEQMQAQRAAGYDPFAAVRGIV